ncbi:MAG: hypothetical protein KAX49_09035 [Halanaerobiales bacterium]|nr:hypothetical protein [Halanaerobiales bacterium]
MRDFKNNKSINASRYRQKIFFSTRNFMVKGQKVLLSIVFLVMLLSFFLFLFRSGKSDIVVAQYGRLTDDFEAKGLFIKSEDVVYAPYAGEITMLVSDGEKVPVGKPVLKLVGLGREKIYYSSNTGVIGFQVDGLEKTLNPVMLEEFQQNYRDFRGKLTGTKDQSRVNAGRPLFKIVDNFVLYLLVEAPADQVFRYNKGEKIWATFDEITIIGWVRQIIDHRNLFVIQLERFPVEIINKRWVDVTIMTDAETGVYVPHSALIEEDNILGVYKMVDDTPRFVSVDWIGGDGINEVIYAKGIDRGIEILANPAKDLSKYLKTEDGQ